MIEFDVETTGVQWYAASTFMVQFGIYDPEAGEWLEEPCWLTPGKDDDEIQWWLDRDDDFRAWNSKFDLHHLENMGYHLPAQERWHDGMIQAKLCAPQLYSHALKRVAGGLFGDDARDPEKELKAWMTEERARRRKAAKESNTEYVPPNYSDVPMEIMVPYAIQDIVLTAEVSGHYDKVFKANQDIKGVYDFEMRVMGALYDVEKRGLPMDREAAAKFEKELHANLERMEDRCLELAGDPEFNSNSPKQVAEALASRGVDLSHIPVGKNGVHKMDKEVLGSIDDDLARAVLEFRAEKKTFGTYLMPMLEPQFDKGLHSWKAPFITPAGRIHPSFNQLGAITGRMSCSEPNVQNWPRDDLRLQYLMRAEPGHKLVTADLDSIELRLFAAYAGEGAMLDLILADEDMHSYTANAVGLQDKVRAGGAVEKARQRGKTFNYSIVYGAGVNSLMSAFGVSAKEAKRMLQLYHQAYPEVGRLQGIVEYRLRERGYINTAFGQRMYIDPREAYKGVNYLIQGTAAGLLKTAMLRLHEQGLPIVALIHDEIVLHSPEDKAEEHAKLLVEALCDHPKLTEKVPILAEADIVDRKSQAKDPDFVPAYMAL